MIVKRGLWIEWKDWRNGKWRPMLITAVHELIDDGSWLGKFEELEQADTGDPRFRNREILRISTTECRCLWPTRKKGPDEIRPTHPR